MSYYDYCMADRRSGRWLAIGLGILAAALVLAFGMAARGATYTVTNAATSSTLTASATTTNDNGTSIYCVVTNAYGAVTSSVVTLEVTNQPAPQCTLSVSNTAASTGSMELGDVSGDTYLASEFVNTNSGTVCRADLYLFATGSPAGTLTAYIWANNSGAPGALVATSSTTVAASSLTSSAAWYSFTFTAGSVSASTTYWLGVGDSSAPDAANYIQWGGVGLAFSQIDSSGDGTTWGLKSTRAGNFKFYIK